MESKPSSKAETLIGGILKHADIEVNGSRPWDIKVHDARVFDRVLAERALGLGEAYLDAWWDCDQLDEFFHRVLKHDLQDKLPLNFHLMKEYLRAAVVNMQTKKQSKRVAKEHYDLGNDFYAAMLDPYMQYSCGYFKDTDDLATAQRQKMDLICRKLQLKKGERVLDIGCGWGGLAKYMAEKHEVEVTGITISEEQAELAREFCRGLPVIILVMDYRDMRDTFDKIVSVGMFEHVGHKNYRTYMKVADRCLRKNGLFLLHTIGWANGDFGRDPWLDRYIFPGGILPAAQQIALAAEKLFIIEDWHNFGPYYDDTLLAWYANYKAAWPRFREQHGERFQRMWDYYLSCCAGGFRARNMQLWQVVLSKKGREGVYPSVR